MKIIVSLTSTSQRLKLCRAALISLATQSLLPDKIILNVSKEPYLRDAGISNSDKDLFNYLLSNTPHTIQEIIEINWVENTGPYRKLVPTLLEADPSDIIVTADDDIFYHPEWLSLLLENFDSSNKTIHAARVRYKIKNKINRNTGYIHWPIINKDTVLSHNDWIITFGGGAVISKSWLPDRLIQDRSYLELAPTADDLWFSKIFQLQGLKVKVVTEALHEISPLLHNDGLVNHNLPKVSNTILSKAFYHLLDSPLNYLGFKKHGNDIAYHAIKEYFSKY